MELNRIVPEKLWNPPDRAGPYTSEQFPRTSIFVPIDLSELGLLPTDETQQTVDKFNMLAANVFNLVTLTEPIEPENPTLPEQVITNMVEPPSNTGTQNRKGKKC